MPAKWFRKNVAAEEDGALTRGDRRGAERWKRTMHSRVEAEEEGGDGRRRALTRGGGRGGGR